MVRAIILELQLMKVHGLLSTLMTTSCPHGPCLTEFTVHLGGSKNVSRLAWRHFWEECWLEVLDSGVVKRCFAVLESLEQVQPPAAPGYAATPWPLTRQYLVVCERRYRAVPPSLLGLGQELCHNHPEN